MQCPVCKSVALQSEQQEGGPVLQHCPQCAGKWLSAGDYWKWREHLTEILDEKPSEAGLALSVIEHEFAPLCPECGHILFRYQVGHGVTFTLAHCNACGGGWFEANEWEILASRNLHEQLHTFFSPSWQARLRKEAQERARQRLLLEKFGAEDYAEISRIKTWLEAHPLRSELFAFLLHDEEQE